MKVAVTQSMNCAHRLPGTEIHGHTYRVTAIHSGKLRDGMVMPFDQLARELRRVLRRFDHVQLETVIGEPATAERLAANIAADMTVPVTIRVSVGDDGWVETD